LRGKALNLHVPQNSPERELAVFGVVARLHYASMLFYDGPNMRQSESMVSLVGLRRPEIRVYWPRRKVLNEDINEVILACDYERDLFFYVVGARYSLDSVVQRGRHNQGQVVLVDVQQLFNLDLVVNAYRISHIEQLDLKNVRMLA